MAIIQSINHATSFHEIISQKNIIPVNNNTNEELNLTEMKYVEVGRYFKALSITNE